MNFALGHQQTLYLWLIIKLKFWFEIILVLLPDKNFESDVARKAKSIAQNNKIN